MPLKIICPRCQKSLNVPDHLAGRTGKCPGCGSSFLIAESQSAPANDQPKATASQPPATSSSVKKRYTKTPEAINASIWQWVVYPLIVVFLIARKFGCMEAAPPKHAVDAQVQQFTKNSSNDLVLGIVIFGAVAWAGYKLLRWLFSVGIAESLSDTSSPPARNSAVSVPPPPPPPPSQPTVSTATQWWLFFAGKVTGPCSTEAVIDSLRCGDVLADTPACPVGSTQWQPVSAWPAFATTASGR